MASIIEGLGVLALFVLVYSNILRRFDASRHRQWLLSAIFALSTGFVMYSPFEPIPGVVVDARHIVLSLAAPFGGTVVGLTSAVFASGIRVLDGGIGTVAGIVGIWISAGAGVFFRLVIQPRVSEIQLRHLALLAGMASLVLFSLYFVPREARLGILISIGPTIVLTNFLGIIFLGLFLRREQRRIEQENDSWKQARIDSLTGLHNRRSFDEIALRELAFAERQALPLSVAVLDIDGFKEWNDTWGHEAGDRILVLLADACRAEVRTHDVVARLGGDEFAILILGATEAAAGVVAERIHFRVQKSPITLGDQDANITVSIGVAEMRKNEVSITALLREADRALYKAKQGGRNRIEVGSLTTH